MAKTDHVRQVTDQICRRTRALARLALCAGLLAGCGASLPIESSAEIGPRKVGSAAANEAETASPRAATSIANQSATTADSTEPVVAPVSARGTTPLPVQTAALAGPKLGSEEATSSSGPSVQAPSAGAFLAMSE